MTSKNIIAHIPYKRIAMPEGYTALTVTLGHSNAIKIMANLLLVAVRQLDIKLYIVNFIGGEDYSSDPTNCETKIVIPEEDKEKFNYLVSQCNDAIISTYGNIDEEDTLLEIHNGVWHAPVVNEEGTHILLASINGIPVGDINPMVNNLISSVEQSPKDFTVTVYNTATDEASQDDLCTNIRQIFTLIGAEVE